MLFMHRIESEVANISQSLNDFIETLQQPFSALDPQAIQSHAEYLHAQMEILDDDVYRFGDKSGYPIDYFAPYALNGCQTHLNTAIEILSSSIFDLENAIYIREGLNLVREGWEDNYLQDFGYWFKSLLGMRLAICEDVLVFTDEQSMSDFLQMVENALKAEAILFSHFYGENPLARALSANKMLYDNKHAEVPQSYSISIASVAGAAIPIPPAPYRDDNAIARELGWEIRNSKEWHRKNAVKGYLNYQSRSKNPQEIRYPLKTLTFTSIYTPATEELLISHQKIPALPLGLAAACAQALIDSKRLTLQEVFSDEGRLGVLTENSIKSSNFNSTVLKLNELFRYFAEEYGSEENSTTLLAESKALLRV